MACPHALNGPVHDGKAFFLRVISPEEEAGIGGMVEFCMEVAELLIGQAGNDSRIAAGVLAVDVVRKHGMLAFFSKA